MRRTSLILWELFKKNTPRHSLIGNVLFLGGAAVAAGFGGPTPTPEIWIPGLLWLTLMGVAAGAAAFTSDLSKGGIRFLEYLPVRRWHVWVANVADGYFWVILFAVAMMWHRTLVWSPPDPADDGGAAGLAGALFATRFTLLAGGAALSFCAFSVATFFRLAVQREAAALFRTLVGAITTIVLITLLPAAMFVTPSLSDLRLPLVLVGLLYLSAGLLIFLAVPAEWGYWRRALLVTWPLTALLSALTLAVTVGLSLHWARLDVADVTRAYVFRLPPPAGRSTILVSAYSTRSGDHLLRLDTETGAWADLGRGINPAVARRGDTRPVGRDGDVVAQTFLSPYGIVSPSRRTVAVSPDTGRTRDLLPPGNRITFEGTDFEADEPTYTADGTRCVLPTWRRRGGTGSAVFVADGAGHVLRRLPVAPGSPLAFDPAAGRLLYRSTGEGDTYRIHDLRAERDSDPIRLPGRVLACAPDLSAAVVLHTDPAGDDTARQSLLVVDLKTLATRPLVSADEMPVIKGKSRDDADGRVSRVLTADPRRGYDVDADEVHMLIDPGFRYAVWYLLHDGLRYSRDPEALIRTDLGTGERTTLISKSELTPLADNWSNRGLELLGFTDDATAALVELDGRVERVDLASPVRRATLARRPEGTDRATWTFSPGLRNILCSASTGSHSVYEVSAAGGAASRIPADFTRGDDVEFLDDDHLIISKAGRLYVTDPAGRNRRQIFGRPE